MTEAHVDKMKAVLRNLISCEEVLEDGNPLEALLRDCLTSIATTARATMIRHGANEVGSPYTTKSPLLCSVQSDAFEKLLISMAEKPR